MGTYLFGRILRRFPACRFGDIIFAGCVLPRDWAWNKVRESNPCSFDRVRNEVGTRDRVAWLAYAGRSVLPGFGMAGSRGFIDGGFVHTMASPNSACTACAAADAPVHNVMCEDFSHSTVFSTQAYIAYFWLPYLWGIRPSEYSEFLELCLAARENERRNDRPMLRCTEEVLLNREWAWAGSRTLREYLAMHLTTSGLQPTTQNIRTALFGTWRAVANGCDAYRNRTGKWRTKVLALDPRLAVNKAIAALLT